MSELSHKVDAILKFGPKIDALQSDVSALGTGLREIAKRSSNPNVECSCGVEDGCFDLPIRTVTDFTKLETQLETPGEREKLVSLCLYWQIFTVIDR